MKKLLFSGAVLIAAFGAMMTEGCKKTSSSTTPSTPLISCASCITAPEAKPENDNSSKGTYKGVIVGSSGTIKFDIGNSDNTIRAFMVIDGIKDTLTATVKWVAGVSYISSFTGMLGGQPVSINFSVDANGGSPTVTSMSIPGHPNAALTMSKETSDNLIECFEGTVSDITTGETGTFDMMLSTKLKKWSAQVRMSGKTSSSGVDGVIDGTKLSFDDGKGSTGSATLSGDKIIDGTWVNSKPEHGTWAAARTL
jgi:hypothetical protein